MRDRLSILAAALWWGSLSVMGFVAVPLLFAHLPSAALAGNTAARLFAAQGWVSLGCGLCLLLLLKPQVLGAGADRRERGRTTLLLVLVALLLALLLEYAVAPRILSRHNLRLWHGLGSLMYVLQWLGAGAVLWRLSRRD